LAQAIAQRLEGIILLNLIHTSNPKCIADQFRGYRMMRTLVGLLLLQLGAGLRSGKDVNSHSFTDDKCGCLNWDEVYKNNRSVCGNAFEFATMSQWRHGAVDGHLVDPNAGFPSTAQAFMESKDNESATDSLKLAYCDKFFKRIRNNICVKVAPTNDESKWYGKSWCYVSAECQSLNGGLRVDGLGNDVGAKICSAEDMALSDKSVKDLQLWWKNSGSWGSFQLTVKMSYPYMGENFDEISDLKDNTKAKTEGRGQTLGALRAKESPVVYDTGDANSQKVLISGSKTYLVTTDAAVCKAGCDEEKYAR